jgi:glutamine synthetase
MQPCNVANSGLLMRAGEQKGAGQVAAAILAGIHQGIQQQIDPGAAITGNGYAQAKGFLPTDWLTALRALEQSAWAKEQLGGELLKEFLAIKHREYREFMGEVGEQDWRWYLTHA